MKDAKELNCILSAIPCTPVPESRIQRSTAEEVQKVTNCGSLLNWRSKDTGFNLPQCLKKEGERMAQVRDLTFL